MRHTHTYEITCEKCGHEIQHEAESVPCGRYVLSCPECNCILVFEEHKRGRDVLPDDLAAGIFESILGKKDFGEFVQQWAEVMPRPKYSNPKSRKLENEIIKVFIEQSPRLTVRQIYYALTVRYAVPKTQSGYRKTCYALKQMRLNGQLPFGWIADNTRWQIKPQTFTGLEAALFNTQELYRRNLWDTSPYHVEIWVEKDALAGVISPVTREYDVPLYVARGYSSMTFIYEAAEQIKETGKEAFIYHFGDYDPAGVEAAESIRDGLREHGAKIHFRRMAVTAEQIKSLKLPTRKTKIPKGERGTKWNNEPSAELDAIPAPKLRELVRDCIEQHIDQNELNRLRVIEAQERATLTKVQENFVQVQKSLGVI